jgi:hypothetical protein
MGILLSLQLLRRFIIAGVAIVVIVWAMLKNKSKRHP